MRKVNKKKSKYLYLQTLPQRSALLARRSESDEALPRLLSHITQYHQQSKKPAKKRNPIESMNGVSQNRTDVSLVIT